MDDIHVRQSTLRDLRSELLSINDRQVAGVDAVLADLTRTQLDLESARQQAEVDLARAEAAYESCLRAAAAAAEEGGSGPDCRGLAYGVQMAEERILRIERAIGDVEQAGDAFREVAQGHRAYLSHAIETMRAALHAREDSVEAYLSYRASSASIAYQPSSANASRAIANDRGTGQQFGSFRIPNPVEAREGRGPEGE